MTKDSLIQALKKAGMDLGIKEEIKITNPQSLIHLFDKKRHTKDSRFKMSSPPIIMILLMLMVFILLFF